MSARPPHRSAGKGRPRPGSRPERAGTGPRTSALDAARRAAKNRGDEAGALSPWEIPVGPAADKPKPRRRLLKVAATVFLVLIGLVFVYRFVPPPPTWLMITEAVKGNGLDYRPRSLNDISPHLVTSAIAAEDARFCLHKGFDVEAIRKALKSNERGGRMRGGSSISQQTAKNVFLWPSRDWIRKGLEAGYTVLIETVWGKRRIMELYLNVAEFAPGVYGAEAASRRLFGMSARDLTPREAARLAAVLPSPRRYRAASPGPYVRRYSGSIQARARVVRNEGLAACVLG